MSNCMFSRLNVVVAADQRQANAVSERPTTTTGIVGGDGSRDSPSPSSVTTSPPSRRQSSPAPASSTDRVSVHRPHSADVDLLPPRPADSGVLRQNGVQLSHHVIQRPTSGHVTTPDTESKMQDASAVSGGVMRYDSARFDQRQATAEFQQPQQQPQQASQFFRAGQYITSHPPSSSSSSYGVDSSAVQHHQQQQQQSPSYPLSYGYDMVTGDARWMLHGQYPRTSFGPARPLPGVDYAAAGYSGVAGGLVGNAAPSLTRRATVEYRAQPSTTAGPVVGAGVYSVDYPSMNFPALPFQATAGYGKQNY